MQSMKEHYAMKSPNMSHILYGYSGGKDNFRVLKGLSKEN